jgi:eukaryotic-like serine/threonine-protein kinase
MRSPHESIARARNSAVWHHVRIYADRVRNSDAEFDGYIVGRPLGRGGSATVYLAHRPPDEVQVALKVLAQDHRDAADRERLRREFKFARQFDHPHIVKAYECGPHWLVMQYVDGGNVGRLATLDRRLDALTQVAGALDVLHRGGIVHCDVKPSNILVFKDFSRGGAVLTDFAVAHSLAEDMSRRLSRDPASLSLDPAKRITHQPGPRPTTVQASLPYAPPEVLLGRLPSAASDEYALACTATELITGDPPFRTSTQFALMYAQVHTKPPRLSKRRSGVPPAFDSVLGKALAKNPELRYETCAEFVAALRKALALR